MVTQYRVIIDTTTNRTYAFKVRKNGGIEQLRYLNWIVNKVGCNNIGWNWIFGEEHLLLKYPNAIVYADDCNYNINKVEV